MFSQAVCEKIGYYVYYLVDPRKKNTFYVGKGNGNRIFNHVLGVTETSQESEKINLIKDILNEGLNVEYFILRHGLTEQEAFEVESALIDYIGLEGLANKVLGHDTTEKGKMNPQEIIALYDAEEANIEDPVVLININKKYKRNITPDELYYSTRYAWIMSERRNRAKYALTTYRGIVREVYEIHIWNDVIIDGKVRWEFEGKVADEKTRKKYLAKSINNYVTLGAQNPIRYVNC